MQMVPVYLGMDDYSDSIRVCVMTEDGEELLNRSVPSEPGCGCELHAMQEIQEKPARSTDWSSKASPSRPAPGSAECGQRLMKATQWHLSIEGFCPWS